MHKSMGKEMGKEMQKSMGKSMDKAMDKVAPMKPTSREGRKPMGHVLGKV